MFSTFVFLSFCLDVLVIIKKQKVKCQKKISMGTDEVMDGVNAWLVDEDDDGTKDDPKEIVGQAEDEDDRHEIPDCTKENIVEDEKNSKEEGEPYQQLKGNYFRKQLACKLHMSMEKVILKNLLVIFNPRKTRKQKTIS